MGGGGKARRRRLSPEERRLWSRVAASADALHPERSSLESGLAHAGPKQGDKAPIFQAPASEAPSPEAPFEATPIATAPTGAVNHPLETLQRKQALLRASAPSFLPERDAWSANANRYPAQPARTPLARITHAPPDAGPVGWREPGLDRRTSERLRKGSREPDAQIDLHGMTAERAHMACLRFVAAGLARQDRVLLVVTGKGKRDEYGHLTARGILRQSLPGWLRASRLGPSIVGIYQAHAKHGGAGAFYVYLKRPRPQTR